MKHIAPSLIRVSALFILSCGSLEAIARANNLPPAVEKAFNRTKSATTLQDYAEVILLCEQAQAQELTAKDKEYLERLSSWAYNRRGEARTALAAEALDDGDEKQAAELDGRALADFEAAVRQDPARWKALHNRGVSYAVARKYELAIADFSGVIELQSGYANAWFNRGEIRYELGQLNEALGDYTQAIRLSKERDVGAFTSRGHAYFRLRRFRESLNDYNRAVQLTSSSADSYANRGDAYQSLGMWELAAADFRRAIDLDPKSSRAYQSAAWLMATCPDNRYRNVQLAVQAANRAVSLLKQSDYRYLDTLAAAQANAGQFDEAKTTLANAIDSAPQSDLPTLRKRLELYNAQQPYRQDRTQTASR